MDLDFSEWVLAKQRDCPNNRTPRWAEISSLKLTEYSIHNALLTEMIFVYILES